MIVKALKLRPLYTALVLAGRDPALREVLEFSAVSIGEEIVPVLQDGLTSPNAAVRMLACECLGALGHVPAARRSRPCSPTRKDVRAAAVSALMRLGCDAAIPAMANCLTDPAAMVREAAVAAFCRMDADDVAYGALALVEDPTFPRRTALTIARANPHAATSTSSSRACRTVPRVRRAAAEALARQPTVDVVGTIEPLLRDDDAEVRRSVVTSWAGCAANASDSC